MPTDQVLCVDFGSTWTKIGLIDLGRARQVATAAHPTTADTDVLDGLTAALADLDRRGHATTGLEILACSSAGGGLRIAVVGNEPAVTVEAGRRAALSSGGQVVATLAGAPSDTWLAELTAAAPDLLVLTGGTDGGNTRSVIAAAQALTEAGWATPVVLAGNADAMTAAEASLTQAGIWCTTVANLVPRIGEFAPAAARAAIRSLFLSHVIGGKGLSAGAGFAELIIGPTPDLVLTATELVGAQVPGGVVVVDVGGATTDVYSFLPPDPAADAAAGPGRSADLVGSAPTSRTVEGDLGVHWSAGSTGAQGRAAGLIATDEPATPAGLARAAAALALGRHAGRSESLLVAGQRTVRLVGPDLREVGLLLGSGGVFRAEPAAGVALLRESLARATAPGRLVPARPRVVIDHAYRLAPIGLLADRHPEVARELARELVADATRGGHG